MLLCSEATTLWAPMISELCRSIDLCQVKIILLEPTVSDRYLCFDRSDLEAYGDHSFESWQTYVTIGGGFHSPVECWGCRETPFGSPICTWLLGCSFSLSWLDTFSVASDTWSSEDILATRNRVILRISSVDVSSTLGLLWCFGRLSDTGTWSFAKVESTLVRMIPEFLCMAQISLGVLITWEAAVALSPLKGLNPVENLLESISLWGGVKNFFSLRQVGCHNCWQHFEGWEIATMMS